jgi:hypothetical protein
VGTNFYIRDGKKCPHCGEKCPHCGGNICKECNGTGRIDLHIGKQSFGWKFIFNPEYSSAKEWFKKIRQNKDNIINEYHEEVFADYLINDIKANQKPENLDLSIYNTGHNGDYIQTWQQYESVDPEGYRISKSKEFS